MAADELQTWWQSISPDMQTGVQDIGVALLALVGGHILGVVVGRSLRARNFDAVLRLPGTSPPGPGDHGFTPTWIAGMLVRLTVWAAAVWWLAWHRGQVDFAGVVGLIIKRTWALTAVLVTALALGSLLAQRLIDCLRGGQPEALAARNGTGARRWDAAGAIGAAAYLMVVLLALLIAADLFDWPLTRSSAQALWQLAQHLLVAAAALVIGSLGARWAREQVTPESGTSPEKRAGQYTALAIVAATTVFAVAVLLSSAGVLLGLAALGLMAVLVWTVRGYLPDIGAGLQLRSHQLREVWLEGASWQIANVGFLTTQVSRGGNSWRLHNRLVLKACLQSQPVEAASH
jgi:hypothetical protein